MSCRTQDFPPLPSDRLHLAAIHSKNGASHPARQRRYDERHNVRYLLGFTEAANAGLLEELLLCFFKCNLLGSRGLFKRQIGVRSGSRQAKHCSMPRSANALANASIAALNCTDCCRARLQKSRPHCLT